MLLCDSPDLSYPPIGALDIFENGQKSGELSLAFHEGRAATVITRGSRFNPGAVIGVVARANPDGVEVDSALRQIAMGNVRLLVDLNNDLALDDHDVTVRPQWELQPPISGPRAGREAGQA